MAPSESLDETGISLAASALASAVDGGMAVSGAVTSAMNEGLAAMEGWESKQHETQRAVLVP